MKILRLMVIGSVALALIAMGGLSARSTVEATTITLSEWSSDETDPSLLSATLYFDVSGTELTLRVTNTSAYTINEIYFNATSDVTGLSLTSSPLGWGLSPDPWHAGGFGVFDFYLTGGLINSGPVEFTFDISGTNPFSVDDFTTELSSIPPGHRPAIAAAKFVQGPGDDSAYGASVPEPSTVLLLGAGLLGLALIGRIRFKGKVKG